MTKLRAQQAIDNLGAVLTRPRRLTLAEASTASGLSYGQVYRRVVSNAEVPWERDGQSYTIAAEDVALLQPYVATVDTRPGVTLKVSPEEMRAWKRTAGKPGVSKWLLGLARKASGYRKDEPSTAPRARRPWP